VNKREAEQVARIIERVFQFEESVDPRTVAELFKIISSLAAYVDDTNEKL